MNIGEIVTGDDLKSIQAANEKNFSQRGYVAPTVYRLAGQTVTGWNYYATLADAIKKIDYLNNVSGAKNITPAGAVQIANTSATPTIAINVDFFVNTKTGPIPLPYSVLRNWYSKVTFFPYRFYKTDGSGPHYAVLDNRYFGAAATIVTASNQAKVNELDKFHREIMLLKSKYNTLAIFLQTLSSKTLTPVEQQIFNEGILLLDNMREDLRNIPGINITYSSNGQISGIGFIPILIIAIIAILALATAWTIDKVTTETQKTARINSSYDVQKWVSEQQIKVAAAAKAGTISKADADRLNTNLDTTAAGAQKVIDESTKKEAGMFDDIKSVGVIALLILVVSKIK